MTETTPPAPLKLNLGCGQNHLAGYVNVDRFGSPDVRHDLEQFPWPWETGSVDEVMFNHVLEHLGATTALYLGIIKELYRVCRADATVVVVVPHPRHEHYLNDPTHVRPITPEGLQLFSKALNRQWAEGRVANTPLGLYLDVDFEVVQAQIVLDEPWLSRLQGGAITQQGAMDAIRQYNNVARETKIVLRVVK